MKSPSPVAVAVSLLLFFSVCAQASPQSGSEPLRFGTAKVDISPNEEVELAGYPPQFHRTGSKVHDRLFCRVIAFEGGGKRLVFVSVDLIGFYGTYEFLSQAICERFGLKPDQVFLSAIHTHSGPALTVERDQAKTANYRYTLQLRSLLVRCVGTALQAMKPAHLGIARGMCAAGVNRRVLRFQPKDFLADGGLVKLGRNPDGVIDREVLVLKVAGEDGDACLFDFACHSRSQQPSGNDEISGDIIGLAEQFVEEQLPVKTTAAALVGASGDTDPVFFRKGFSAEKGRVPETVLLAMMLGEEVVNLQQNTTTIPETGPLQSELSTLQLPSRKNGEYITDSTGPKVPLAITVASLGDIAFVGLGCELLTEVGQEIKRASPFRYTFLITHCNGGSGYLPPPALYKERGYEVTASPFGPEAANMVTREALRLLFKQYEQR